MILVNSGAFLSISGWFSELTELIFFMIPYISSTGYPPTTQGIMGHVQVANMRSRFAGSLHRESGGSSAVYDWCVTDVVSGHLVGSITSRCFGR